MKQIYSVSIYENGTFGFKVGGGGIRKRKDIAPLFGYLERKITGNYNKVSRTSRELIRVSVYEDGSLSNSGSYTNPKEAIYMFSCFLEDYLSKTTIKRIYRNYFGKAMKGEI